MGGAVSFAALARDAPPRAAPMGMAAMAQVLLRERLSWALASFYFLTFGGFVRLRPLPAHAAARRLRAFPGGRPVYAAAGFAMVASVVLEYGLGVGVMALVRAGVATLLVLATPGPWRPPALRTTVAWCVWSAHWLLLAGLWLAALAPAHRVDLLHVVFMGGFTLLVLAVAMRVVLSHGGHDLVQERRSWPLRIGIATLLLALVARLGAAFAPESFFEPLAVAALLWIAG